MASIQNYQRDTSERLGKVEETNDKIAGQVVGLKAEMFACKSDIKSISDRLFRLEESGGGDAAGAVGGLGSAGTSEVADEILARERKRLNIVLFKVKEYILTVDDVQERARKDIQSVKSIFQTMGVGAQIPNIATLKRLGREPRHDRQRPILVEMDCPDAKRVVMANARRLQGTLYSDVVVSHDETDAQRQHRNQLREECSQLNLNEQGNYEWRVVTRDGRPVKARVERRFRAPAGQEGGHQPVTGANAVPVGMAPVHPSPSVGQLPSESGQPLQQEPVPQQLQQQAQQQQEQQAQQQHRNGLGPPQRQQHQRTRSTRRSVGSAVSYTPARPEKRVAEGGEEDGVAPKRPTEVTVLRAGLERDRLSCFT